jgi:hypothetical protein
MSRTIAYTYITINEKWEEQERHGMTTMEPLHIVTGF